MKITYFILSTVFCLNSHANYTLDKSKSCFKEVRERLNQEGSKDLFRPHFSMYQTVFRSPTRQLGRWVQVSATDKAFNHFWIFGPQEKIKYNIGDDCLFKLDYKSESSNIKIALNKFNDSDLVQTIKKGSGLIYVLNPSFGYSVKFLPEIIQFSKENNLKLTILFASRSKFKSELERSISSTGLQNAQIKFNNSNELKMRQLELHSPSLIFYKNGKLASESVIGVHNKKSLSRMHKKSMRLL